MSFQRTRIYYRNPFLHIGHLNTLFHNNSMAKQHGGICYAINDDRLDHLRFNDICEDFQYLDLKHVEVISVRKYQERIMKYTEELVRKGDIYIYYCNNVESKPSRVIDYIRNPVMHFQLKLRNKYGSIDPSIGYTRECDGKLVTLLIFDYIIKVLDTLLNVTE